MATADCELVFYGQIAEQFLLQEVKENVAALFKAGPDQVERMFTGRRVVIRNKLDLETADKYIAALRKRGAICQIERMGAPGEIVAREEIAKTELQASPESVASEQVSRQADNGSTASDDPYYVPEVKRAQPGRPEAMPLAGEKTDEILAGATFDVEPVGVRLSDQKQVEAQSFPEIDNLSVAPAGADIGDKKEDIPAPETDVSHLSLAPLPSRDR